MDKVKIFISYSHADEEFRSALSKHLSILERNGIAELWDDRRVSPGDDWEAEIDPRIEMADILLMLVSADYIASNYCYEKEMKGALAKHDAGHSTVIPIIVRSSEWKRTPLANLQALPTNGKPVQEWEHPDRAWSNVVGGIAAITDKRYLEKKTARQTAQNQWSEQMCALSEKMKAVEEMMKIPIRNIR